MSEKKGTIIQNNAPYPLEALKICREISIKDICEECERATLYPEENCGCPTTVVVCEEVPQDDFESSSKTRLPEAGL